MNYTDIGHRCDGQCAIWYTDVYHRLYVEDVPKIENYTEDDNHWGHSNIEMCAQGEATFTGRIDKLYRRVTISVVPFQRHKHFSYRDEMAYLKSAEKVIASLIYRYPDYCLYRFEGFDAELVFSPFVEPERIPNDKSDLC
jgi:hypothetical protein